MFTSRLPVSTSVRRTNQKSHVAGSTSFGGLNRPSNIPVTVKKINLFTPQTKRPLSMGMSTAGKSYMSAGMATDKKYQRLSKPVPDRDMQIKMFDILVEFLTSRSYPYPIPDPKKFFSSISTTESSRIFEFIIRKILTDFKINKLETDVPEALAQLEYPYIRSVTKSALVSVTTRQAVVGLLVIFNWLIGMVDQLEFQGGDVLWPDDGELNEDVLISQNVQDPNRRDYDRIFEELYPKTDLNVNEHEIEHMYQERDRLEQKKAIEDSIKEEARIVDIDRQTSIDYLSQMEQYQQVKNAELVERNKNIARLEEEITAGIRKSDELKDLIRSHTSALEEASRYDEKIHQYEADPSELRKQIEEIRSETILKLEGACQRIQVEFENEGRNFKDQLVKIDGRIAEEEGKCSSERERLEQEARNLSKIIEDQISQLENERRESEESSRSNYENLKKLIAIKREQVSIVLEREEGDVEKWKKQRTVSEENRMIVRQTLNAVKRYRNKRRQG